MKHTNVQQLFSQTSSSFTTAVAIDNKHRSISYGELAAKAERIARSLLGAGMTKGAIVAIMAQDVVEVIATIIGTLKAGGVFCPLDPGFPVERLRAMLGRVSPQWYVVESRFWKKYESVTPVGENGSKVICLGQLSTKAASAGMISVDDEENWSRAKYSERKSDPDDMCSIYFTSGSTGLPKPIAGRLKAIDHFVRWEIRTLSIGPGTRVSQLASPSFDGFLKDVFVPLCAGGIVCVPEDKRIMLDAPQLIQWVEEQKIEILQCVPSILRSMINAGLDANLFSALRCVVLAGEALLPEDVKSWMEIFGERIQLLNLYGPTETTVTKFFYQVKADDVVRRTIPIGKPIEGAAALVVDESGQPCTPGSIGEIYIRTPYCALGYYGLPELTREVFIPNPFSNDPNDIVYKTGDYGRMLEDGSFEFLGRRDHQVKIRGVRIELGEIEDVLRRHEMVKEAQVIDLEDITGNKYLCAYVILATGVSVSDLREYLSSHLPEYMVPSSFVVMESMPRMLNGKIDRRALALSKPHHLDPAADGITPRTPVEEILAGIWAQVLGLKQIGIHRNFFELGGHSLLATQVISRVREAFRVELPLRSIFEAPTVARFASSLETAIKAGPANDSAPLVPVARDQDLPLSLAQERLWFLDQSVPGVPINNFPYGLSLRGRLIAPVLEQSLNEVVRRQEILRTSIQARQGRPFQSIATFINLALPIVDLQMLSDSDREATVRLLALNDGRQVFDTSHAPLMRAHLLRLEEESYALLTTMHHIITDVWSFEILIREVVMLYESFRMGEPSALKELPIQYADYAVWQRQFLKEDLCQAQFAYWKEQLADRPARLDLSINGRRPKVASYAGASYSFMLPEVLTEAVKTLSRQQDVTLFMTLLAGFQTLLHRYTGQEDIVVGSPVATRNRPEFEDLIGFFINTIALRTNLSGNPTFAELLARVREVTMGAYTNQDLPFAMLVEKLHIGRQKNHSPLFQTWFLLDHIPVQKAAIPDLEVGFLPPIDMGTAQFDLILNMLDLGPRIRGIFTYNKDLFDGDTIAEMSEHFASLLFEAAIHPECPILDLPLDRGQQANYATVSIPLGS